MYLEGKLHYGGSERMGWGRRKESEERDIGRKKKTSQVGCKEKRSRDDDGKRQSWAAPEAGFA